MGEGGVGEVAGLEEGCAVLMILYLGVGLLVMGFWKLFIFYGLDCI